MKKIIFIIPCYNEEKRFNKESFISFTGLNPHINFLFVNDGSTDNTLDILSNLSKSFPNYYFLNLNKNIGKAEAIRAGVNYLKGNTKYEYIGYLDADLSTPLSEIQLFMSTLDKHNELLFLMGARFQRLGANIHREKHRHYIGRVFATIVSIALKIPVYDTQCGAKLIHSSIIEKIFHEEFISKWLFDVELIYRYKSCQENIKLMYEIPLNNWQEIKGSKMKILDFIFAPFELLRIIFKYYTSSK